MCIGIPMQVQRALPGQALCRGRGESRSVNTALVGEVAAGEWLLVFQDCAVQRLDAHCAAEIDAALDLLAAALAGVAPAAAPAFALPSALGAAEVAALVGDEGQTQ
jgi:hydrogenase expression/formation protein HypC